ncbi:MAG: hypothetical protein KJ970_02905 [Candidatus Eisenbacteria bacterium]|uniref:Uncharacterized protein n=1 Tax=Eiseniibacteriota bacterium TaxID=2212470 RepID=A0A948RS47_UNCEI|nr:hypothetical protein [Candidatus Eisenbacteria bacterium]MBU1949790.1 hypothetical protein [Candidatus Eisenbacteria bacterium]MBU2689850.1 hypothetical protein [Candidatus Eisenbacteria bacterium]
MGLFWGRRWFLFLTILLGILLLGECHASIIDYFLEQEGFEVGRYSGPGSTRLDGMGRLELVIEDENNEINLSDYGGNGAGVILDKDRWSVETWSQFGNRLQDPREQTRRRFVTGSFGTDIIYRLQGKRAYGLYGDWRRLQGSRNYGDVYEVKGSTWHLFYNERPFSWMAAAITYGGVAENEDRVSDDVFSLKHRVSRPKGQVALAFLINRFQAGWTWDFLRGNINGKSRDAAAFHTDTFTWYRPLNTMGFQLVYHQSEDLQGGVFIRTYKIDGAEKAEISWSDRFPDNGGRQNFQIETTSFIENEDYRILGTRWLYKLKDRYRLGASITQESRSWRVEEGVNFKGTRRAEDVESDAVRLGLGASATFLRDRVQVGIEGYLERGDMTSREMRDVADRSWEDLSVRLGGEVFWKRNLVLRAGAIFESLDLDVDLPATRQNGTLYTVGASYLPRGGLFQLDGAIGLAQRRESLEGDEQKLLEELTWSLGLRYIL